MQAGVIFPVSSIDGTHFVGSLAQNASLAEDLPLGGALGAGGATACRIRGMSIVSSDNLAWEVQVFGAHDGPSPDPNLDRFLGYRGFMTGGAIQIGALWYYYIDGLDIPYRDQDLGQHVGAAVNIPQLHLRLANRSAGAKTAYSAGGRIRLTLNLEPMMMGG
jgi:hypothetical protein